MRNVRKMLLLGLVATGLLLIGFVLMSGTVDVSATQWTGLNGPIYVAIGDYDNDGFNDLAFTDRDNYRVIVYKSDGTTIIKQWTGLASPSGVAIGDYNNDGLNDIAITDIIPMGGIGNVTVYKNDGITIIKKWAVLNPMGVAIGDYDNDGLNEIAFSNAISGYPYNWNVTVYKSDGTTIVKRWTGSVTVARDVAIGDYDHDGLNELAFTEDVPYQVQGKVTVYKSDGETIVKQWTGLNIPHGVAIGDYDNDGLNELAFSDRDDGRVAVCKSDGITIAKQWTGLSGPAGVAIGDYNNDGLNDIAFVEHYGNRVTVYYQTKPGTVARVAEPTIVTLRGTLTNTTGYPIQNGSLRVTLKDSFGTQVWQDTFDNVIDNGRYNIPLGTKTTLMLIKGQIYNAVLEVDADSLTFVSADVTYGDNNPPGDIIKFVAD